MSIRTRGRTALACAMFLAISIAGCRLDAGDESVDPQGDSDLTEDVETVGEASQPISGLPAPMFIYPKNDICYAGTQIPFQWTSISDATRYRLQVSRYSNQFWGDSCGVGCEHEQVYNNGDYRTIYLPSGTHYARVRAGNAQTGQGGIWSGLIAVVNGP